MLLAHWILFAPQVIVLYGIRMHYENYKKMIWISEVNMFIFPNLKLLHQNHQ
jgi:hypothetical protein